MGFLKNLTIKTNTKRIFSDFNNAYMKFFSNNPEVSINEALRNYSFLRTIPVRGLTGGVVTDASIFHEYMTTLPEDENFMLLFQLICSIVYYELQYDITIGSNKDMRLVMTTLESRINKERSMLSFIAETGAGRKKTSSYVSRGTTIAEDDKSERLDCRCPNCDNSYFVYDKFWKEYSCKNCGQVLHKEPIVEKADLPDDIIRENRQKNGSKSDAKNSGEVIGKIFVLTILFTILFFCLFMAMFPLND